MNKILSFGLVSLFLIFIASFVTAEVSPYHTEFAIVNKVEIFGTVVDEFNEGEFYLNKPIPAIFKITNNKPAGDLLVNITFYSTEDDHHHNCVNASIPKGETQYLSCEILPSEEEIVHTGLHYVNINLDGDDFIFNSFKIRPPLLTPFVIALFIIGLALLFVGVRFAKEFLPLGMLVFNGGVLQTIFIYQYLLNPIFIGIISLYIVANVYIVFVMMKEW